MSQGCMEVSQSVWRVYVGEPGVYGGEPECMESVCR